MFIRVMEAVKVFYLFGGGLKLLGLIKIDKTPGSPCLTTKFCQMSRFRVSLITVIWLFGSKKSHPSLAEISNGVLAFNRLVDNWQRGARLLGVVPKYSIGRPSPCRYGFLGDICKRSWWALQWGVFARMRWQRRASAPVCVYHRLRDGTVEM